MLHSILEKWLAHAQHGGEIIIPIYVLSVVMWTLIFVKTRFFFLERKHEIPEQSNEIPLQEEYKGWQKEILSQYSKVQSKDTSLNRTAIESIQETMQADAMRHVKTIMILAAIAPLLGLLGTVTGMIATFDVISVSGTGNARALASGISEALITTQSGLIVAVPGMLFGSLLYSRANKLSKRIELFCIGLQHMSTPQTDLNSGE